MGYNNNGNNYQNNNYNNGSRRGNYDNNQGQQKKRSGAKFGRSENGGEYVSGWNISKRRGFLSLIASPAKSGELEGTSKSGKQWVRYVVKLHWKDTGNSDITSGFWYPGEQKLRLPEYNMVASCRAPNGGYFGTMRTK